MRDSPLISPSCNTRGTDYLRAIVTPMVCCCKWKTRQVVTLLADEAEECECRPARLMYVLRLRASAGLDLDENVDQRNGRRGHTGDAARLGQSARAHALQFFVHLAGEAADRGVIKPLGDRALLGLLQALDGALLLLQVTGVFDGGFD